MITQTQLKEWANQARVNGGKTLITYTYNISGGSGDTWTFVPYKNLGAWGTTLEEMIEYLREHNGGTNFQFYDLTKPLRSRIPDAT